MKIFFQYIIAVSLFCGGTAVNLHAQADYKIPSVNIQDLNSTTFNTENISNNGKPIIISFWATWCKPCIQELNAIADVYEDWKEETGVKLVAISTDDVRNVAKVPAFVSGRGWEFEVYCDPNGDFKRALSVNSIPHTFLVDGNGNIVWQHNSYNPGDEDELFHLIQKLSKGQSIDKK